MRDTTLRMLNKISDIDKGRFLSVAKAKNFEKSVSPITEMNSLNYS